MINDYHTAKHPEMTEKTQEADYSYYIDKLKSPYYRD